MKWAAASGYVTEPPKAPDVVVPNAHHVPVYEEDIQAVVREAPAPLGTMLKLFWEGGLRYAEAASLRRCDLDLDTRTVRIEARADFQPKTKASYRDVNVTPGLLSEMRALTDDPVGLLFPCPEKHHYAYWRVRMRAAQDRVGVRHFCFHDLRRAVADRLRRSGVPVDQYCAVLGHSPLTGLRHYSIVCPDDMEEAHRKGLAAARHRREPATSRDDVLPPSPPPSTGGAVLN